MNGVNIFMMQLILSLVPEEWRAKATTAKVCDLVVKPMTEGGDGRSFAEMVGDGMMGDVVQAQVGVGGEGLVGGTPMVGEEANVFVSHAWGDPFCQVVAAVYVSFVSVVTAFVVLFV